MGASKFLRGLRLALGGEELTVIVNTGDDITLYGLRISPDIDTVIYWLSGAVDRQRGWGQKGDTFRTLGALERFGVETWFKLGDLDLATHIYRTWLRREGKTPTEITRLIAEAFGVKGATVLPMTDADVETWVETDRGFMHFQDYFIRERMKPPVLGVELRGMEGALPAPGVVEAIAAARGVIICPSNPIISVGTILGIRGIREALCSSRAPVVAISPIVGGKALKGPADRMMRGLGLEPSSRQIAKLYRDFLHTMVIDRGDAGEAESIRALGVRVIVTDTIMRDDNRACALAQEVVEVFNGAG